MANIQVSSIFSSAFYSLASPCRESKLLDLLFKFLTLNFDQLLKSEYYVIIFLNTLFFFFG